MKSETMNNVKIPQRGYSQNEVFSARRLGTKMEINILGKGGEKKKKTPLSVYKYIRSSKHSEENDRRPEYFFFEI